jgi:3-phenylpropionate/trans-cinnamate dioxygenase ferredoxin reductase component
LAGGALIIGASLSGLRVAEQLRAAGYNGPMTIVGAERHMPYNRPPLSKDVLFDDGGDPLIKLTFSIRPTLADVTWHLGQPAVASDLARRTVTLADGRTLSYDVLAVATGLTPRRLALTGAEKCRHVVRTIDDATRLKSALVPGARVVVAGGGFIGCETAASAKKRGCDVTIVEPLALPMGRAIGPALATAIKDYHQVHGVKFKLGTTIDGLILDAADQQRLKAVALSDGTELAADILIEALGSVCNTNWLEGNGLDLSDGVLTDTYMRAVGADYVTAAGDVARFPNPRYGATARRIEHWAIPGLTAKRAAQSMIAELDSRALDKKVFDPIPTFWSDQFGIRMQSVGIPALADRSELIEGALSNLGQPDKGLAMGYYLNDALVGVISIGLPAAKLADYRAMLG